MILDEQQVRDIFLRQFAIFKRLSEKRGRAVASDDPMPWPGYAVSVERAEGIAAHTTPGVYPERLFSERAPNQTDKEAAWIRANYKQTTLPVFVDFSNTIERGLHPGNWSIEVDDPEVEQYITKGIKEYGSIDFFTRFLLPRLKINDAMGVIAVLPLTVPTVLGEDGEPVVDGSRSVEPVPVFYPSAAVIGFEYDAWYLVLANEKSEVTHGTRTERTGLVFYLFDEANVWKIAQTGKKREDQFAISVHYPHNIGEPPVVHAGGNPSLIEGSICWVSPYMAAKDLLDIALLEEHYLRATKAKVMFPHTVMVGDPCDFVDLRTHAQCVGGVLNWTEGGVSRHAPCPGCNGTGHKRRLSPFGELMINADPNAMSPDSVNATNALTFVVPPTGASEFIRSEINETLRQARAIMHLDMEAPMQGGEAKTATQTGMDARAREAFVRPICDQILGIHQFIISCIGRMMRGAQWEAFTMSMPSTYDVRDEGDVLADLQAATASGLPPVAIGELMRESVRMMGLGGAGTEAAIAVDRLAAMSEGVVRAEIAAGRVEPWEVLLHYGAGYLLGGIDTAGKDIEAIGAALVAAAKAAATAQGIRPPGVERLIKALDTPAV